MAALEDDGPLLAAARAGDMRAFAALIDRAQPLVRAFLRRLTGNAADADDLAQEAFARTAAVLDRIRPDARFSAFVCGVAYKLWLQARRAGRSREKRERAYSDLYDEAPAPKDAPLQRAVRQAMQTLSPEQQAALSLCIGADFTHQEAAEALNLPLGTVKSHVSRGLARLRQALGVVTEGSSP